MYIIPYVLPTPRKERHLRKFLFVRQAEISWPIFRVHNQPCRYRLHWRSLHFFPFAAISLTHSRSSSISATLRSFNR